MTSERRVLVHRDTPSLADAVAARFITKMVDLLDEKREAHIVLTGGGVGIAILTAINNSGARESVDWARVHVWWGDERWLPADHADRNDRQAREALLDHVALRPENIHPFPADGEFDDLDEAARAHAATLAAAAREGAALPLFDITFLGVGPDGHVASLFPNAPGIHVTDDSVIAVRNAPKPPPERLSLTMGAINSSDRVWLALAGADKASALCLALAGVSPIEVPAAGPAGKKRTVFFVDAAAAADIPEDLISQEY
ncbi:MAG: 6-phosphogluconolactonase [Microbacteriaceae bacterium]|jgi:6-phosphogluconolactonase|nr:6-phosphogluconolactonase [Microbacteriaceae bacterium]HEV7956648.1 6-phosphogluconolactonase [Marisediminicola sp.]